MASIVSLVCCADMRRSPHLGLTSCLTKTMLTMLFFTSGEQRYSNRVFTRQFNNYDGYRRHCWVKFAVRHPAAYDPPPRQRICPHMRNDLHHTAAQVPASLFSKDSFEYSPPLVRLPLAKEQLSKQETNINVVSAALSCPWDGSIG
jgi:hypothetical protein